MPRLCFACGVEGNPPCTGCGGRTFVEGVLGDTDEIRKALGQKPITALPETIDLPKGWDSPDVDQATYLKFCEEQDGADMDNLLHMYMTADREERETINDVLMFLCGYGLPKLVRMTIDG